MNVRELREMNDKDLLDLLEDQREAMFNLRFQKAFGQLEEENALRRTKRDIAQILTILRERQIAASASAPETNAAPTKKGKK